MPRKLILIPRSDTRLEGAIPIEPGYAKDYTPEEMREWADDLDRYNHTPSEVLDRIDATPRHELSAEQRRLADVHAKYFVEPEPGIKGSLREDGQVELDGGRHRAAYIIERDVDPVPVWVSAPSERQLEAFDAQCARERAADANRVPSARTIAPPREARVDRRPDDRETTAPGGERVR